MSDFSGEFVTGLAEQLKKQALSPSIKTEVALEKVVYKTVRKYIIGTLDIDDQKIDQILFTHGNTKQEKKYWTDSKPDQNVIVFGCSNTSDIFIKEPRLGTIYIELKYSKRRGIKASTLPGDLQRSIGQSVIASIRHDYVICLIVCEAEIKLGKNDYSEKLRKRLWRDHKIALIVRNLIK